MALNLGDRHTRPIEGLGLTADPKVVVVRAGDVSGWIAGQHLLVCITNLLARLHGSVGHIILDARGTIEVVMPHHTTSQAAYEAMADLALWANGGAIPVTEGGVEGDLVVDISRDPRPGADLYAFGSGWKAWVGTSPISFSEGDRSECLGPYLAAALAVGELFKLSKGLLKGRYAADETYSLWSGEFGQWDELSNGPVVPGTSLPPFYIVGAGAVGQGLIQILGASNLQSAYPVTIDHDHHDLEGTNLNRCFLAGVEDIGEPKVDVVRRYRQAAGFAGYEFEGKLTDYLGASKPGLDQRLAVREIDDAYDLIFSAVDINSSRQDIQGLRPTVVVGGSTDGLRAQTNVYGIFPDAECLGCWNEPENTKARAIAKEAELRGLSDAERRATLEGSVDDIEAALAYLAQPEPKCGQLGEAAVRSFSASISPEFSVSFVSMAAAVMAGARLFSHAIFSDQYPPTQAKGILQFKNLKAGETNMARRANCSHCDPAP